MLDTRVSAEFLLGTPKTFTLLFGQLKQHLGGCSTVMRKWKGLFVMVSNLRV